MMLAQLHIPLSQCWCYPMHLMRWWVGKDLEGHDLGHFKILSWDLLRETEKHKKPKSG